MFVRSRQDPGPHVNGTHVRVAAVLLDDQHRYRTESGLAMSCAEVIPDPIVSKLVVRLSAGLLACLT